MANPILFNLARTLLNDNNCPEYHGAERFPAVQYFLEHSADSVLLMESIAPGRWHTR